MDEQKKELGEVLLPIADGPHVNVVDVNEHRSYIQANKQHGSHQTFLIFDVESRLIVDSFVLEPSEKLSKGQRASLQIKNVSDRIFIVEKLDKIVASAIKKVQISIWEVLRKVPKAEDGAQSLNFELLADFESIKGCKPVLQDVADRFLMVVVPNDRTWIYDYKATQQWTIDKKLAPIFRPVLP